MEKYFIFLWNRITVVTIIAQSESALGKDVRTSEAARVRLKKHQKNTPLLIEFLETLHGVAAFAALAAAALTRSLVAIQSRLGIASSGNFLGGQGRAEAEAREE